MEVVGGDILDKRVDVLTSDAQSVLIGLLGRVWLLAEVALVSEENYLALGVSCPSNQTDPSRDMTE